MSINKVLLDGRVTNEGPKLSYTPEGHPQCALTVLVEEANKEGAMFRLFVPVEIFGAHAEWVAEHVNVGDRVLIDGKLKWKSWLDKQGEKQGRLGVMGWQVSLLVVSPPAAVATH